MKNRNQKGLQKILLLLFYVGSCYSIDLTLQGFVPPGVSSASFMYEFKRIYSVLNPGQIINEEPLTIIFFTEAGRGTREYSLPEWGGGGAIGAHTILIRIDKKPFLNHDLYQTAVHELAHIVINRVGNGIPIPRWFHEGVAMALSGDASTEEGVCISKALFTGSLLNLSSIDSVNGFGKFRAELAYCQSRVAVRYLIDTYEIGVVAEIIKEMNHHRDFWMAMDEVLHISEKEFEFFYRKYLYAHHGKFFWLIDTYFLWIIMVVLFLLGYIITIYRKKKKYQLLDEESDTNDDPENTTLPFHK